MEMVDLLPLLSKIHRTAKGFMARCPVHKDRQPSLSLQETEDRILIYCFAGCPAAAICQALGIQMRDLFHGNTSAHEIREAQHARKIREQKQKMEIIHQGRLIDARREAEALLRICHGQDLSQWNNDQLDRVMNSVGQALAFLRDEDEEHFYEHIGRTGGRV